MEQSLVLVKPDAIERGLAEYIDPAFCGYEAQADGVEIQQQGIGADVIGTHGVVVKGGGVSFLRSKRAVIQYQIAVDFAQAAVAQFVQP